MYNTTKILKGLLENSNVQVDLNLEIASVEVSKDRDYYLYAQLETNELGYEYSFELIENVTGNRLPLSQKHDDLIAQHLLQAMNEEAESELTEVDEMYFDHAKEYGINNNQFINLN